MENLMYVVPVVSVLALLFAGYLAVKVAKQEEGTEKMKEIASAISEGARAFLTAEYKILIVFVMSAKYVFHAVCPAWHGGGFGHNLYILRKLKSDISTK